MWRWSAIIATLGAIASARVAMAQESPRNPSRFQRRVAAPSHALELSLAAGYDQGVGALGGTASPHVQDVAGIGAGMNLGVGYRFSPRIGVAAFGAGALYTAIAPIDRARSLAVGVRGSWHFRPYRSVDPWISVGAGYRLFWDSLPGADSTVRKAIQALALGIGVDYRLSPEFGIGPFISGDLSFFFRESLPDRPSTAVSVSLSSFVSAGISARFDFLGQALHPAMDIAAR
jgi:hypothetical protein